MSGKLSLSDKYTKREGRVFLNGTQALVRLPMVQRWHHKCINKYCSRIIAHI